MLLPRKNNYDVFDNFFGNDDFFTKREQNFMKTDIIEKKNSYEIAIDLPGFSKENINLSLNNGYLEIHAEIKQEENKEEEKFLHQERFFGECSRKFYIGDTIKEEEIEAQFKEGLLKIEIPIKEEQKEMERKQIEIK